MQRVKFESDGTELIGDVFLPQDRRGQACHPGVVVAGSWTTVKEQMAGLYARRLAEHGYTTLAFDFSGYGASEGEPREYESPARKIRDLAAAEAFLRSHPAVARGGVGMLAVCAASGYAAHAIARDTPFRSLAMVAPWLHDNGIVTGLYGASGVTARIERGRAARRKYDATREVEYVPAVSTTEEFAAMYGADFEYYLDEGRGAIPEWRNRFATMSWPEWLEFDAMQAAPTLRVPTLIVHSEQGALPDGARRFAAAMPAPPTLVWIDGASQFDFYDREPTVTRAVDAARAHFDGTLAPSTSP